MFAPEFSKLIRESHRLCITLKVPAREHPFMDLELAEWMKPSDSAILNVLDQSGLRLSNKVIAVNTDYERHYVSRRCRALQDAGLIFRDEGGLYQLTPFGIEYLEGEVSPTDIPEGPPERYSGQQKSKARSKVYADEIPLVDRLNFNERKIDNVTWGFEGSDQDQLAFALLGDVADGKVAMQHAEDFSTEVVAEFDQSWEIAYEDIQRFLDAHEA